MKTLTQMLAEVKVTELAGSEEQLTKYKHEVIAAFRERVKENAPLHPAAYYEPERGVKYAIEEGERVIEDIEDGLYDETIEDCFNKRHTPEQAAEQIEEMDADAESDRAYERGMEAGHDVRSSGPWR